MNSDLQLQSTGINAEVVDSVGRLSDEEVFVPLPEGYANNRGRFKRF